MYKMKISINMFNVLNDKKWQSYDFGSNLRGGPIGFFLSNPIVNYIIEIISEFIKSSNSEARMCSV